MLLALCSGVSKPYSVTVKSVIYISQHGRDEYVCRSVDLTEKIVQITDFIVKIQWIRGSCKYSGSWN